MALRWECSYVHVLAWIFSDLSMTGKTVTVASAN